MEIRKRSAMKNKIIDECDRFEDNIIVKRGREREVTRGEFIGKEDKYIIGFETQDMFNKVLNSYLETVSLKSRDKVRNILLLYFVEDITQTEIADIYENKQSYISKLIRKFTRYIKRNQGRFL